MICTTRYIQIGNLESIACCGEWNTIHGRAAESTRGRDIVYETPSKLAFSIHLGSELFQSHDTWDKACDITRHITQHMSFLIPEIEEGKHSLKLSTSAEGWKEINIRDLVSQLTSRPNVRVSWGTLYVNICMCLIVSLIQVSARNQEYVQPTASTRREKVSTRSRLMPRLLPSFLWDMLLCNNTSRIRQCRQKLLIKFVDKQWKKQRSPEGHSEPYSILFRILSHEMNAPQVEKITRDVLNLSLASYHSLSSTMEHLLYDLVTHPKYVTPMRRNSNHRQTGRMDEAFSRQDAQTGQLHKRVCVCMVLFLVSTILFSRLWHNACKLWAIVSVICTQVLGGIYFL